MQGGGRERRTRRKRIEIGTEARPGAKASRGQGCPRREGPSRRAGASVLETHSHHKGLTEQALLHDRDRVRSRSPCKDSKTTTDSEWDVPRSKFTFMSKASEWRCNEFTIARKALVCLPRVDRAATAGRARRGNCGRGPNFGRGVRFGKLFQKENISLSLVLARRSVTGGMHFLRSVTGSMCIF